MRRGEGGFTVIEVIVVLAIAGGLLLGAFYAMTASIENTRFNDTITSTQSFLQKQYLEVQTGKNVRDNTLNCDSSGNVSTVAPSSSIIPGSSNCILLGRMLTIKEGDREIISRYIVGTQPTPTTYATESQAIRDYNPKLVNTGDTQKKTILTFGMPWNALISKVRDTSNSEARYFAVLRSPVSERILIYSNLSEVLDDTTLTDSQLNQKIDICVDSDNGIAGRTGHIMVGAGQGQDLFTAERVSGAAC